MSAETRGGNAWDRWRQRVRCLYGGELDVMLDIFWALNLGSMGTTRALSLPGVMAHLLWAVFLEKIISRKAAKPQRDGVFLCAPASLREKIISRKAVKRSKKIFSTTPKSEKANLLTNQVIGFFL